MISNGTTITDGIMSASDDGDKASPSVNSFCRDYIRGFCTRENCRYLHEAPPPSIVKDLFRFCHDYQNKGCFRSNCKFIHISAEDEERFYATGMFPRDNRPVATCHASLFGACHNKDCKLLHPPEALGNELIPARSMPPPQYNRPPPHIRDDDSPPEAKYRRFNYEDNNIDTQVLQTTNLCPNCESLEHKVKLLHDNISVLLKKIADLSEKNIQLTSMNEFLLEQTASVRSDQPCVITSRHCTSAPVSLATVSVTPVVSLAGALPTLVPAGGTPNHIIAPAASRAQLLTPAPQILTVSTTQQLVGNSGALIVTSAGAQQLMQVSDSGTLMGGGQTVVAVTPAQLTLAQPTQQLISNGPQTAVQVVQQSALQSHIAPQNQPPQYAVAQQSVQQHLAQQSAQHLAAQQSAQHLAAQQNAQHLAAQQSAQLAAQQSAQHLAAQQSAQQLAAQQSAQQLAAQQSAQQQLAAAQQSAQHLAAAAQQSAQQLAAAAQQSAQQMVAQHQQSAQQLAAQQSAQQQMVPNAQQLVHQTSTQQITISSTSQPMALPNSQAQSITFPMISQSILPH
ncbi:hypothetical protein O0L34_g4906 [Tuta absoluta]|nr:hypothetical protein O0L34_g4906 [Tuta absoluta]